MLEEPDRPWVLKLEFQMRNEARHEHEIERGITHDLIGDMDVTAPRVPCFGNVGHRYQSPAGLHGAYKPVELCQGQQPATRATSLRDWFT